MNNSVDASIEPLPTLEQYSLDEINLLEVIDPNDLKEWIEEKSENASEDEDATSIDPDDLKEWMEVMSCEDETALLECLLEDDIKEFPDDSNANKIKETVSETLTFNNISSTQVDNRSAIEEQIAQFQNKLEVSMRKTEISRQQFLMKKRCSLPPSLNPSTLLNKNLNDFVVGKRKSLTSELEESRKRLRMLQPDNRMHPHTAFFAGRRTSLTSELEKSRNRLKMLGGFKTQLLTTTRLSNCGQPTQNKSNNALMA